MPLGLWILLFLKQQNALILRSVCVHCFSEIWTFSTWRQWTPWESRRDGIRCWSLRRRAGRSRQPDHIDPGLRDVFSEKSIELSLGCQLSVCRASVRGVFASLPLNVSNAFTIWQHDAIDYSGNGAHPEQLSLLSRAHSTARLAPL